MIIITPQELQQDLNKYLDLASQGADIQLQDDSGKKYQLSSLEEEEIFIEDLLTPRQMESLRIGIQQADSGVGLISSEELWTSIEREYAI